jgi:hypothetical protein
MYIYIYIYIYMKLTQSVQDVVKRLVWCVHVCMYVYVYVHDISIACVHLCVFMYLYACTCPTDRYSRVIAFRHLTIDTCRHLTMDTCRHLTIDMKGRIHAFYAQINVCGTFVCTHTRIICINVCEKLGNIALRPGCNISLEFLSPAETCTIPW